MTDSEISIAIAEVRGWTNVMQTLPDFGIEGITGQPPNCDYDNIQTIPNYCRDLNAMQEVLQHLESRHWHTYIITISNLTNSFGQPTLTMMIVNHNATARQRAEAFLRTLGLWQETKEVTK